MHAILLGSGLSSFVDHFTIEETIPYGDFLDFKIHDLQGHERNLYIVKKGNDTSVILSGKLHLYEGYSFDQIVAPLKYALDNYTPDSFTITSASGGLSASIQVGQWVDVNSIICLPQTNGLIINLENNRVLKSRFMAKTYAFHQGPSLGTRAEYKMLAKLGADLVGMSMLPETTYLVKKEIELRLLSLPVCNYFPFNTVEEPSHEEVIQLADAATIDLWDILQKTKT